MLLMNIKGILLFTFFSISTTLFAQSTFFSQNRNDNHFIDRIEILNQNSTHLNYSSTKPYNRKFVLQEADLLDSLHVIANSKVDRYNLQHLYLNNTEWTNQKEDFFKSKK